MVVCKDTLCAVAGLMIWSESETLSHTLLFRTWNLSPCCLCLPPTLTILIRYGRIHCLPRFFRSLSNVTFGSFFPASFLSAPHRNEVSIVFDHHHALYLFFPHLREPSKRFYFRNDSLFYCSLCLIFPAFSRSFLLSRSFLSLLSLTLSLSRPYAMRNDWKLMCPCLPIHLMSVVLYSQALQNNPLRFCSSSLSILVNTFSSMFSRLTSS